MDAQELTGLFEGFIGQFHNSLGRMKYELDMTEDVLMSHGWIVVVDGIYLVFYTDEYGVIQGSYPSSVDIATRLTKEDAINVAADVFNGKGVIGKAVFIRDALKLEIANLEYLIETYEEKFTTQLAEL